MSNRAFNTIRLIGEVIIPFLTALYVGIGAYWGWPYLEAVGGTGAAITACIGGLVNGLREHYNKQQEEDNGEN